MQKIYINYKIGNMVEFTISYQFFYGFVVGFFLGIGLFYIFCRTNMCKVKEETILNWQKIGALLIFLAWLVMHLYGFFNNIQVDFMFDVIGGAVIGDIFGVNLIEIIKNIGIQKKK